MIEVLKLKGTKKSNAKHILIVSEGFTGAQLPQFHDRAKEIAKSLSKEPWYPKSGRLCIWQAYNPVSNASKYDLKVPKSDLVPGLAIPKSNFNAKFSKAYGRLFLSGNDDLVDDFATKVEKQESIKFSSIMVFVNYPKYGGSGTSQISWSSFEPKLYLPLAIHELGHTFNLYDEYENKCGTKDAKKLPAINIWNISSDLTNPWWKPSGSPPLTIATKASSTTCLLDTPIPAVARGLFPGGHYTHKKYYRSAADCRMRTIDMTVDFCEACVEALSLTI